MPPRGEFFFEITRYVNKNIGSHMLVVGKNNNLIGSIIKLCLF
jgi:hypothetical protein